MTLDISRVQAICFDVDGTLSDTDDQWTAALERHLMPLRWLFPNRQPRSFARWAIMCAETPGNLVYHLLDRMHLDDDVGRIYNFLSRRLVGRHPRSFWLIEGVRSGLETLCQRYPLSVVSARDRKSTLAFLEQFALVDMFSAVATAQTCRYTKPFPDPVIWAAAEMGVPPENCLMVGDTTVDIRAGKAAGAQTVGVLCGFGQEAELRRAGADLILPSTADLARVLVPALQIPPALDEYPGDNLAAAAG
jgi:N-acetyl-D-muramate 6-phosphate phosphatase